MAAIQLEKIDDTRIKAHVQPTPDEIKAAEEAAISEVQKSRSVPGFRKGKVPVHILRQKFQAEIRDETFQITVRKALPEISKESENGFYEIIRIENADIAGGSFRFDLSFDVEPYVKIGKLKDVQIREDMAVISQEDIRREMDSALRRFATYQPAGADARAAEGDLITGDYEVWSNDAPAGEPVRGYKFVLGDGRLDSGLESAIIRQSPVTGGEVRYEDTVAEGASEIGLAKILTITAIEKPVYPEVSDAWVTENIPPHTSVTSWRDEIQERMQKRFHRKTMEREINSAMAAIHKNATFYFPENFLNNKIAEFLQEKNIPEDRLSPSDKQELSQSIRNREENRLIADHAVTSVLKEMKKDGRTAFREFLEKDAGEEYAGFIMAIFDRSREEAGLDQFSAAMLNSTLALYQLDLLERFFRGQGLIKKGKKIPYAEGIREGQV